MTTLKLIMAVSLTWTLISCKKQESNTTVPATLSLLQNKWTLDSLVIYQYPNYSGQRQSEILNGYEDFRTDGKRYGYSISPGNPANYDTSQYTLTVDNKAILDRFITHGVVSNVPDTLTIATLDKSSLVLSPPVSNSSPEFVKLFLHR